jgi:protein O-mannosyl-transferase
MPAAALFRAARAPSRRCLTADRIAWILPAVVAIVVYAPALRDGFALDDVVIIADNQLLHHLATIAAALARPYWYDEGHLYRPLTTLAFGLEWALGSGSPVLFHVVNVAWHAVVSALVARLALRWWSPAAAAAAGAWFAVHPVHAEAVANIVGRSELVCGAALLALALIATRNVGSTPPQPRPLRFSLPVFLLAMCAMASKETGAMAPAIVWLAAITPIPGVPIHGEPLPSAERRRRALSLAIAAAAGVFVMLAARLVVLGTLAGDKPHYAFRLAPGWRSTLLALATAPRALGLVLVPQPPRLDYSPPDAAVFDPALPFFLLGGILVVAAALVVLRHLRRPAAWSFIVCFAACTYLPASNLLLRTGVVLADRTLYSPSVGAALACGAAGALAWTNRRWFVVAGMGAVSALGIWFTIDSLGRWLDSPTAFAAIRDRSPTSYVGHYMCAKVEDAAGETARAQAEYATAVALVPHNADILFMAGANAERAHDQERARELLTRAVTLEPDRSRARTALIGVALHQADTAAARTLLEAGLALDSTQRVWRDQLAKLGRRM